MLKAHVRASTQEIKDCNKYKLSLSIKFTVERPPYIRQHVACLQPMFHWCMVSLVPRPTDLIRSTGLGRRPVYRWRFPYSIRIYTGFCGLLFYNRRPNCLGERFLFVRSCPKWSNTCTLTVSLSKRLLAAIDYRQRWDEYKCTSSRHRLVGRGPPFAYWRKVGLQAYTKICSGVLCNIVVKSLCYCTIIER